MPPLPPLLLCTRDVSQTLFFFDTVHRPGNVPLWIRSIKNPLKTRGYDKLSDRAEIGMLFEIVQTSFEIMLFKNKEDCVMELIRKNYHWDPLDVLSDLQTDFNRVFNRSLNRRENWLKNFAPEVEVREEGDHYVVHADLPGLKKEDFNLKVQGSTLTLSGERKNEKEVKEKTSYYSERSYGSFSRTLEFPTDVQADKVSAVYKNGVLEITLPKAENAKAKEISVEIK